MRNLFLATFILIYTLHKSQDMNLNTVELLQKQNRELKLSLDDCLTNSQKGLDNIEKLLSELNNSNKYIKTLITQNAKNDSLNLRLVKLLKANINNREIIDSKNIGNQNSTFSNYNSEFTQYESIGYGVTNKLINKQNSFEFSNDDSILMLDLKLNIFVVANEKNKIFYIYDSTEPTLVNSGDIITEYYAKDEREKDYIIRFIKIKDVHPNRKYDLQIYIDYDDVLEIYNIRK